MEDQSIARHWAGALRRAFFAGPTAGDTTDAGMAASEVRGQEASSPPRPAASVAVASIEGSRDFVSDFGNGHRD